MDKQFIKDLEAAKGAESLVREYLSTIGTILVEDVSENPEYYYVGDIKISTLTGQERFIEVKDDSCIWRTGNVLCEEYVE